MFKNKKKYTIVFMLILSSFIYSQESEPHYSFQLKITGGYSYFETALTKKKISRFKPGGTLNILWKPEHLLSIGVETGFLELYSYKKGDFVTKEFGTSNVNVEMSVIPLMFAFSMGIFNNFDVLGGIGGYLFSSKVDAFQSEVVSTGWTTGYSLGGNFNLNLSSSVEIGLQLKWYYLIKMKSAATGLHITFLFPFIEY